MADRKVVLLLKMIASADGRIDATDHKNSLLNYFCGDRGKGLDTFNLAVKAGLIKTTFHDMFETSDASLTDAGRAVVGGSRSA